MNEDKKCANCKYWCPLEHNFTAGKGFEKSHCCVFFPLVEKDGFVMEVGENGICEVFTRRELDEMSTLTLDDMRPTAKWDSSGRYGFGGKNGDLAVVCTNCFAALTEKEYKESVWNYCPVCGAKMGGGK